MVVSFEYCLEIQRIFMEHGTRCLVTRLVFHQLRSCDQVMQSVYVSEKCILNKQTAHRLHKPH